MTRQFDQSTTTKGLDHLKVEREMPVGGVANASILFLLAIGSGLTVFVGVGVIVWALGESVKIAMVAAGVATLLVWAWWLAFKTEALLWSLETVTGKDFNQDGSVGEPEGIRIEVYFPEQNRWQFVEIPDVTPQQFEQFTVGLLQGRTLAETEWSGKGKLFTIPKFKEMRAELLARKWIVWRNERAPTQGLELTVAGRAILTRYLESVHTHAYVPTGHQIAAPGEEE